MKSVELAKAYDPKSFEERIYEMWKREGLFKPKIDKNKRPFTIVIPPPNVTGALHLGHALDNCLQDIQVRYRRMKGIPTLWLPGTDHAGIATQNVVERKLRKEGRDRESMGAKLSSKRHGKWQENIEPLSIISLPELDLVLIGAGKDSLWMKDYRKLCAKSL